MQELALLILSLPVGYGIIVAVMRWARTIKAQMRRDWRNVPPPNWASSRRRAGGDYW